MIQYFQCNIFQQLSIIIQFEKHIFIIFHMVRKYKKIYGNNMYKIL